VQRVDGRFIYSASDLNDYLECKRLTDLEALVAYGLRPRGESEDPQAELLRRKGDEHEQAHLERLERLYEGVEKFERSESAVEAYATAERATLDAMQRGVPIIYQATFFDGRFLGHADFLRRVERPSRLGAYGYEVIDAKLGLHAKPKYLVQLCNYSEHLARLQGTMPEFAYVVLGNGEEKRFRLRDYMAYYRRLKERFLEFVNDPRLEGGGEPREYPYERAHCKNCDWNDSCEAQRRADDHVSLVARIRRDQIGKFEADGIGRITDLAAAPDDARPKGMNPETFAKLRRQARLQVRGRTDGRIYELVEHAPPLGFGQMPAPAEGDVFFDIEGDPLYEPGRGLEYLLGCWMPDEKERYRAFWGTSRADEKRAFEDLVDFIVERRTRYPAMHVYHYSSYEKSALRRLAQQHATREEAIDDLLRDEVFVDLFAVVRQTLVISEEHYGLKNVEGFYGIVRETGVKKGDQSIVMFERWLLDRDPRVLADIEEYNRDDCESTQRLRDWLLERRDEAAATFGIGFPPYEGKGRKREAPDDGEQERTDLERALLDGVLAPATEQEYAEMTPDRRAGYLLGNLLAYHRREAKPAWWAFFDRCENVDDLLEFDREALGGLTLREEYPPYKVDRSTAYTYAFPEQLHKIVPGKNVVDPRTGRSAGTILSIDEDRGLLVLKTRVSLDAARAIEELIPPGPLPNPAQRDAVARIADSFLAGRVRDEYPASFDLLTSADPRLTHGGARLQPAPVTAGAVTAAAERLDRSYLFVQGPPGSGKSTIGAQVICDLLARGKRIAVTSTSHKAIQNLLRKIEECAHDREMVFGGAYKEGGSDAYVSPFGFIAVETKNEPFYDDAYRLAGGTAFLFAREELDRSFDYLFVDEAGQVSLADALAVSTCAKNVVLLGDPSQLAQVSQGSQPLHVGDSVLEHLLGDEQTVQPHRGIFFDVTYRMRPEICAFISDSMYEGRLRAHKDTLEHRVAVYGEDFAGLYFVPVEHAGNSASSAEEADEIVAQIERLRAGSNLPDDEIIVVAPYNAQRRLIKRRLHDRGIGVEVGTVDKFQGQQASVVFYSMATSSGDDVPRNVEFLFERNRFNVAISRAKAASVLVCSPRLLDIACNTPDQMALANLLCEFAERATSLAARSPLSTAPLI